MALKQNITANNYPSALRVAIGLPQDATELYIRIQELDQRGRKCYYRADFHYRVLLGKENNENSDVFEIIKLSASYCANFEIDESVDGLVLRKQAYEHLKTLFPFTDCEDC